MDFTLYNGAEDLTTVMSLLVEFPLSGGLNTSHVIQTHKFLRFIDGKVDPFMVCEVRKRCISCLVLIHDILW